MSSNAPTVSPEPLDALRCTFTVDPPVAGRETKRYRTDEEAVGQPVAAAVLGVPGVCEVIVSGNVVTVIQDGSSAWRDLEPQVTYAIRTAMAHPEARPGIRDVGDDDEAFDIIAGIFESQINPAVAQHGGKVELIDVQDMTVVVRMMGGCQGCGMANVTLRQGIEGTLKRVLPGVRGIKDITDHTSGTNPYFQSAKK